jgi:hypothetical protein
MSRSAAGAMKNRVMISCASPATFAARSGPATDSADQFGQLLLPANLDPFSLVQLAKTFGSQRSQQPQLFPLLPLLLLQEAQPGTHDLARISIAPGIDLGADELIKVFRKIDVSSGHRRYSQKSNG